MIELRNIKYETGSRWDLAVAADVLPSRVGDDNLEKFKFFTYPDGPITDENGKEYRVIIFSSDKGKNGALFRSCDNLAPEAEDYYTVIWLEDAQNSFDPDEIERIEAHIKFLNES